MILKTIRKRKSFLKRSIKIIADGTIKKRGKKLNIFGAGDCGDYGLYEGLQRFSLLTSLPGFRFIGEERSMFERIFWTCMFVTVFALCGFQIYALVKYWNVGKILMSQENVRLHVWDTPFPAITVCSENQLNEWQLLLAEHQFGKHNTSEYSSARQSDYHDQYTNKMYEDGVGYGFRRMSEACNDTVLHFAWVNDIVIDYPCRYFQPVLTYTGLCFSFNMIPHERLLSSEFMEIHDSFRIDKYFYKTRKESMHWDPSTGFQYENPLSPPWHVAGFGELNAVAILLDLCPRSTGCQRNYSDIGTLISLNTPVDYPYHSAPMHIQPNTFTKLMISTRLLTSSEELKKWNPMSRGCYYQHERSLNFFRVYTQNNCELECQANVTRDMCGCVAHYHPRSKQTPICGPDRWDCIVYAGSSRFSIFGNRSASKDSSDCGYNCFCFPLCTEIIYDISSTTLMRNWTFIKNVEESLSTEGKNVAMLYLHFRKKALDEKTRTPMIRYSEFVANIAGVISFSIGCTIISLFEVLYFIMFRKHIKKPDKVNESNVSVHLAKRVTANIGGVRIRRF